MVLTSNFIVKIQIKTHTTLRSFSFEIIFSKHLRNDSILFYHFFNLLFNSSLNPLTLFNPLSILLIFSIFLSIFIIFLLILFSIFIIFLLILFSIFIIFLLILFSIFIIFLLILFSIFIIFLLILFQYFSIIF